VAHSSTRELLEAPARSAINVWFLAAVCAGLALWAAVVVALVMVVAR
jgi:hypothetical protein